VDIATTIDESSKLQANALLYPAIPNPFKSSTLIHVELQRKDDVQLIIFNSLGQEVETVYSGQLIEGMHEFQWFNQGEAGVFHCILNTSNGYITRRLVSIK
jgi:hypothetical protein